jgi:abhydrolase domain-containing protein 12
MPRFTFQLLFKYCFLSLTIPTTVYFGILGLIVIVPTLQTHIIYLHRITLTWFKDLNVPETFGFLHNQVTPFSIETDDGETLYAWHVLPLGTYRRNEGRLLAQPSGLTQDIKSTLNFKLLRNDPDARLVIYLHGAAGTVASGWRPDSYRALYSGAPDKIHVLTFDYRGYGLSTGSPSEEGLLGDAIAVTSWAMNVAGVPASRIVIFGQSLGSAVGIALSHHFASRSPPVSFAGVLLVASFSDVASLTATYRIGGLLPVLSPVAKIPKLLNFFHGFLQSTWLNKDRIADFVRRSERSKGSERFHITLIHAEDDTDVPCVHTKTLWRHAINSLKSKDTSDESEPEGEFTKTDLGAGGWVEERRTEKGVLRVHILRYGLHDRLMAYPVTGMAVLRAFQEADPTFAQ